MQMLRVSGYLSAWTRSPAGWKLTILLEELHAAGRIGSFSVKELDLDHREHKQDWFLEINPNGRIPALVHHNPAHASGDFAVWESGAIMLYLAEQCECFVPPALDVACRYEVLQWLCFQLSGVGPMQAIGTGSNRCLK